MKHLNLKFSLILQLVGLVCLLAGCSGKPQIHKYEELPKSEAFLGISLTPAKNSNQMLISGVVAGPFALALREKEINALSDSILFSIGNQTINQQNWQEVISALVPGDEVTVQIQHSDETVLLNIDIEVGNKNSWQGPINKPDSTSRKILSLDDSDQFTPIKKLIWEQSHIHQQQDAVLALHELFNDWQNRHYGFNSLSRVNFPFQQPMRLLELEQSITNPLGNSPSQNLTSWLADNLDLNPIKQVSCEQQIDKQYLIDAYQHAKNYLSTAFAKLSKEQQSRTKDD